MLKNLMTKGDATSTTPATGVLCGISPFLAGEQCFAHINYSTAVAGNGGIVKIQSSPDNTTWTDAYVAATGLGPDIIATVTCDKYMRAVVSTVYTAGTVSVYLVGLT